MMSTGKALSFPAPAGESTAVPPPAMESLEPRLMLSASFYSISDVGSFADLGLYGHINAAGAVAATRPEGLSGIGYTYSGTATDLALPGGYDYSAAGGINVLGQAAGFASTGSLDRAVLWSGGAAIDLGALADGQSSAARAVNDKSVVTGDALDAFGTRWTFRWTQRGGLRVLTSLGGTESYAYDINRGSKVVGSSTTLGGQTHAVLWSGSRPRDLSGGYAYSEARAVNNSNMVVGLAGASAGEAHAALWYRNVLCDLGTLGGDTGEALGINGAGLIVGTSRTADGDPRAFVWFDGVMYDLNNSISASSGWELTAAWDINDAGQIVGLGTFEGEDRVFLLAPRKLPVLVVPGILGSLPGAGDWTNPLNWLAWADFLTGSHGYAPADLVPETTFNMYGSLLDALAAQPGYAEGQNVFFAAYDWRRPAAPFDDANDGLVELGGVNFDNSTYHYGVEYLQYWIERARTQYVSAYGDDGGFGVNIVAHSLGGLLARAFVQSDYYQANYEGVVRNVVTIGTAHKGTVDAFLWLTNPSAWAVDPVGPVLHQLYDIAGTLGYSGTMAQWAPSIKDLLPTWSFVSSTAEGTPPDMGDYVNRLMLDLNADKTVYRDALDGAFAAGSSDLPTPTAVRYVNGTNVDVLWGFTGDGGVLFSSAALQGVGTPANFGSVNHIQLPRTRKVRDFVIRKFAMSAVPGKYVRPADGLAGWFSDVDFLFTDPEGQRLGYTVALGAIEEIPGARMGIEDGRVNFSLPATPKGTHYTLVLTGTGAGEYHGSLSGLRKGYVNTLSLEGLLDESETLTEHVLQGPISYADSNLNTVTMSFSGVGLGLVNFTPDHDVDQVLLGTNNRTKFTIKTPVAGTQTAVGKIVVHGSLAELSAATTVLTDPLEVDGTIGRILLAP